MIHLAIIALVAAIGQTSQPSKIQRIHGIIDKSQTWSGTIVITDDVSIEQGDVTVEPGTIIEFAKAQPPGPVLKVGSGKPNSGRLGFRYGGGPVIFRTRAGCSPGRIVIDLFSRGGLTRRPDGTIAAQGGSTQQDSLDWRGLRFEDIGAKETESTSRPSAPAILIIAHGSPHEIRIGGCKFIRTAPLKVITEGEPTIQIDSCEFSGSNQRVALWLVDMVRAATGRVWVRNNRLDAAIQVRLDEANIEGNVLIGPNACLSIGESGESRVRVRGNYVHNTSTFDEGRYCLSCESPETQITGNCFRGGAYVVYRGSRHMQGNVFIGEEKPSGMGAQAGRTQALVAQLPAGAVFERNILIGPASSILSPQPSRGVGLAKTEEVKTIIRNNTFEGARRSPRAIHLGEVGRAPATFEIYNNLFFRIECMLFDERASKTEVALCDFNATAPEPPKRYERATVGGKKDPDPAWGKSDLQFGTIGQIKLNELRDPLPDFDADIVSRKITVEEVLKQIGSYYRPSADSPLVRGGRPTPDSKIFRETIGACEADAPTSQPAKP
jgi:hypothetical protein